MVGVVLGLSMSNGEKETESKICHSRIKGKRQGLSGGDNEREKGGGQKRVADKGGS